MNKYLQALVITLLIAGAGAIGFLAAQTQTAPSVGAISGPNIPYSYLQWGAGFGITKNPTSYPLTTGTTTPCAIASPAATSTLRNAGITETTSSTTASRIVIAKAATPYATTTQLAAASVAAGAQATVLATSTADTFVIAPSQYIVFGQSGGGGTFSPEGRCWAEFDTYTL